MGRPLCSGWVLSSWAVLIWILLTASSSFSFAAPPRDGAGAPPAPLALVLAGCSPCPVLFSLSQPGNCVRGGHELVA